MGASTVPYLTVANTTFSEYSTEEGYLELRPGDRLRVFYVGQSGDEAGWLFGATESTSAQGWFPDWAVDPISQATGPARVVAVTAAGQTAASDHAPAQATAEAKVAELACRSTKTTRVGWPSPPPARPICTRTPPIPNDGPLHCYGPPGAARSAGTASLLSSVVSSSSIVSGAPQVRDKASSLAMTTAGPSPTLEPWTAAGAVSAVAAPQPAWVISDVAMLSEGEQLLPPGFDRTCDPMVGQATGMGLLAGRDLPIYDALEDLDRIVTNTRVVVIDAATGSGKSTMVPIRLAWQCANMGRACRVVVTQPRRLAAKGLAKRVADQTGTQVGKLAGYRVGHDHRDMGSSVVYVTAGHLLEALVHNPYHLSTFSHIVLDEVHERFVQADFLMALLRLSLSRPETAATRIIVMSATLQQALGKFFKPLLLPKPATMEPGKLSLPGRTPFEVKDFLWEDIRERWPGMVLRKHGKSPNFAEHTPSKIQHLPPRRRSDNLTQLCKALAPYCAQLLIETYNEAMDNREQYCVALVFLPGLDQMRQVQEAIKEMTQWCKTQPKVYLMHSAFEQSEYEGALEPPQRGEWRIALATNIAESSLTVPGASVVIDFGLHRVAIHDDNTKMTVLATEWCSKASMKQRRGRTGRTNPGKYIQLLSSCIIDELPDFDGSDVQRAPLTRITLEAAHLARLISARNMVRAGMPVRIISTNAVGVAEFFDGATGGWRVTFSNDDSDIVPEEELEPLLVDTCCVLDALPTPPPGGRVRSALSELREMGLLTNGDAPSLMGTSCLKLPTDVPIARLVLFGWMLGCPVDGVVLAAGLSLFPCCDVLRTVFNSQCMLDSHGAKTLKRIVDTRSKADNGQLSEPLALYTLFNEWLQGGGSKAGLGHKMPKLLSWADLVNDRLWLQFIEMIIDLTRSLLRLVDNTADGVPQLTNFLKRVRGEAAVPQHLPQASQRQLIALLTWSLAPLGFIAVGQTPALYGGGSYKAFQDAVKHHKDQGLATEEGTLLWPKLSQEDAVGEPEKRGVVRTLGVSPSWSQQSPYENDGTFVGVNRTADQATDFKFLYRLCGPFNGREIVVPTTSKLIAVNSPRNPCVMNWYMPRRDGRGMMEVRVGWKSEADSMMHVPTAHDRISRCRPKAFLVGSGAEYQNTAGRGRFPVFRGTTVLPQEDGGRTAILWLLAAGEPREGKFVGLMAPGQAQGEIEVRSVRLWRKTIWLRDDNPITSSDLRVVNSFRRSLIDLQHRKPHRLAGYWLVSTPAAGGGSRVQESGRRHIECVETFVPISEQYSSRSAWRHKLEDVLWVSLGPTGFSLRLGSTERRWEVQQPQPASDLEAAEEPASLPAWCEEEEDGGLLWSDGTHWIRPSDEGRGTEVEMPALSSFSQETLAQFHRAAGKLFDITSEEELPSVPSESAQPKWLARLCPVRCDAGDLPHNGPPIPFNLVPAEEYLHEFREQLGPDDVETAGDRWHFHGDDLDAIEEEEDQIEIDTSQEGVEEEWMWTLANRPTFSTTDSRNMVFVETSIALPKTAVCVECEEEDKAFSKSQLAKHPDDRRCKDCIEKAQKAAYKPSKR